MEAISLLRQGAWDEALDLATRAVSMARAIDLITIVASGSAVQARALFMMGQQTRAMELMAEGLGTARKTGAGVVTCCYFGLYAEMCYFAGDLVKAMRVTDEALKFYDDSGMNIGRIDALRAAALTVHGRGQTGLVAQRMHEALNWARAKGAKPDLAVTLFRFSEALERQGEISVAAQFEVEATMLFKTLGMTWWLSLTERNAA